MSQIDGEYTSNYLIDGTPCHKRRKVYIPPSKPYTGNVEDIPMLAAENSHADEEAAAPMDGGDMIDFNYNVDGLTYSKPSFAF